MMKLQVMMIQRERVKISSWNPLRQKQQQQQKVIKHIARESKTERVAGSKRYRIDSQRKYCTE